MNPKEKGELAEAKSIPLLMERGYKVSIPFGERTKYDLLIDDGEEILRAQVKKGILKERVIKSHISTPKEGSYTSDEIDIFIVYCDGEIYEIDVEDAPDKLLTLRLKEAKNNQQAKIRWASDYAVRPS